MMSAWIWSEGAFVCLSGPSGSGKTTLLNAIGGLDTPDSGEITVGDQRLDQLSRGELADLRLNSIGFVFQAYNLIPVLSARENVEFMMQVQGVPAEQRRQLADEVLAEVGLTGLEERRPASCPVASNSGWPWPAPLPANPPWCWPMNPLPTWTATAPRN